MQRSSSNVALCFPSIWADSEQVPEDPGVALSTGDVETVPAVLVLQERVGTVLYKVLDHVKVLPCASHHQRSPKANQDGKALRFLEEAKPPRYTCLWYRWKT